MTQRQRLGVRLLWRLTEQCDAVLASFAFRLARYPHTLGIVRRPLLDELSLRSTPYFATRCQGYSLQLVARRLLMPCLRGSM